VDVALQSRAFLYGANASGKSNFLDSIRFLHDLVAPGGGFQEAISKRGGVSKLRCLSARRFPDVEIAVSVAGDGGAPTWDYEISFTQDSQRPPFLVREIVRQSGKLLLDRPGESDRSDPAQLGQTAMQQVNVNRDYRELADFFRSVRYLHLVPQLVRETDRYSGQANDPFGSDFLKQVASTRKQTRDARLRRIGKALKVAVPHLQELEFFQDKQEGTPHLRGKYDHWRPRGAWQTEDQFSDGTLRLLALLWVIQDGAGPLLLEEPELSLHPELVRHLPQMFARMQKRTGRQIIVSSHSTDLIHDEGIGLDEVLLLNPGAEGTSVAAAASYDQIRHLVEGGAPLADAVISRTRPPDAMQLVLFGKD